MPTGHIRDAAPQPFLGRALRLVGPSQVDIPRLQLRAFIRLTNHLGVPFAQFRQHKLIYRKYAGLYFILCVDVSDNELACLEAIHLFVEILDHFFNYVREVDLVHNFHKVFVVVDEILLSGELQDTSKKVSAHPRSKSARQRTKAAREPYHTNPTSWMGTNHMTATRHDS